VEQRNLYRNGEAMVTLGNPSFEAAKESGLLDLSIHNLGNGYLQRPDGREFINMCSCSYLGLSSHPAIIEGAIQALRQEKTMGLSVSRLRIRLSILDELEARMSELYRARSMVTLSASAASAGILPLIASGHLIDGKPRVMVFDKSAHFSMNLIKPICADEAPVLTSPHNDLNYLEDVCKKHERVAYVADGFYSMGGATKVKELMALQERYGLFLYFDDSHGLSIYGERGEGFVRALLGPELNPLTVVIGSLGKAFGTAGGVVMLGPTQHEDLVARFAGPLGWSQAINTPNIGASLASARIHASPELGQLQQKLRENIRLFDELVPTPHRGEHFPIKVIEIGEEAQAVRRSRQMLDRGFYTSAVFFPIVPRGKAGLRIMLRSDLSREDVQRLGAAVRDILGQE
jgi:7-keto-8-aminopelargonate synthetase-like enzyme